MQTNQMFPDVSIERRPKIKEKKKINLAQLFPDISDQIRTKSDLRQKTYKGRFLKPHFNKPSDTGDNKTFKWFVVILTLSITLLIYLKTFSFEIL